MWVACVNMRATHIIPKNSIFVVLRHSKNQMEEMYFTTDNVFPFYSTPMSSGPVIFFPQRFELELCNFTGIRALSVNG